MTNAQILTKAKSEKDALIKGIENIDRLRIPLESYMNYSGTIGFENYMNQCNVPAEFYSRITEFHNACGMSANGENPSFDEFLENELEQLNNIHCQYADKIYDMNERIVNVEANEISKMPEGKEKQELMQKVKERLNRINAWRKHLAENAEKWREDAKLRREARQRKTGKGKQYFNANDELPEDVKEHGELKSWVKRNHEVLNVSIGFLALSASLVIIGMKLARNN